MLGLLKRLPIPTRQTSLIGLATLSVVATLSVSLESWAHDGGNGGVQELPVRHPCHIDDNGEGIEDSWYCPTKTACTTICHDKTAASGRIYKLCRGGCEDDNGNVSDPV